MDRNQGGMSHRWGILQAACNKWHGIQTEIQNHAKSGTSISDHVSRFRSYAAACIGAFGYVVPIVFLLDLMLQAYRDDNKDVGFKFLHVFKRIETCDKWILTRAALAKAKEGGFDHTAGEGRPIGNKVDINADPAAERLQASVNKCIADTGVREEEKACATEVREEKANVRWSMMLGNQDIKISLLRTMSPRRRPTPRRSSGRAWPFI